MGRRKGERRLADRIFKMADRIMADFTENENLQNRPFHRASISGKVPCPHVTCRGEAGEVFFERKGLAHHYRIKHVGAFFQEEKITREALRLFKFLHGTETKQHLEMLTSERLLQVCYNLSFVFVIRIHLTLHLVINIYDFNRCHLCLQIFERAILFNMDGK